ncbi:hypothetical protein XENTR_v10020624 [Xenopus tropicalis]|nr:hypothetical protein XENTR_v10020624 [Xenopus tropicalis]
MRLEAAAAGILCKEPGSPLMDSEVLRDGRILDLIDDAWREDKLPYEDVTIPLVVAIERLKSISWPTCA